MAKKYVELRFQSKLIAISPVYECEPLRYIELEKEASSNFKNLLTSVNLKISSLQKKVEELEKEVKVLKGED